MCLSPGASSSFYPAGAWSFSVSELAAPGVEVGRLTATDPDLGENAQFEFTILDAEEAETFNISGRDREAVIVLNKVSVWMKYMYNVTLTKMTLVLRVQISKAGKLMRNNEPISSV